MSSNVRPLLLFFSWCVLGALPSLAQPPSKKAPVNATRSLETIVAIADPAARITALQALLKTNANNAQTNAIREALVTSYAQLGEAQLAANNIERAVEAFTRAIQALPKQVSDRFFEATVSKIPMAVSTRGYRAEAVALGRTLEKRFATEPARLAALGEFYLTIEAIGEAIQALEAAARLTPEDARLQRALGAAYRMGLRIGDAVAAYQLAVRYDAKDRRAFYELANLYRSQGNYDDAIKLYRRQLEIDPLHIESHKGMALALLAQGKDEQAQAALNQARELHGGMEVLTQDILFQTQLAFQLLAKGKIQQARQSAEMALALEPRFSWARLAAAEIDLAEGKYFEAEKHLLAAQQFANFPTLNFSLGKIYLIVEDFDGAAESFAKAFRYSPKERFTARLGGVRNVQSDELRELLAPEHQAPIFLADPPTSDEQFKIAETLTRINALLHSEQNAQTGAQLDREAREFVAAESARRSFRALFMAQKLAQAGQALPTAIRFAEQALDLAEIATEAEGSLRDYPNYDRDGRLRVFRGRAHDARGWALFKSGQTAAAVRTLSEAVSQYSELPEGKRALWHLATAQEATGDAVTALEMYLAAYEPPAIKNALDVNRTVIEVLYRKVHGGSLNGLDARLSQPLSAKTNQWIADTARGIVPAPNVATKPASIPTANTPNVSSSSETASLAPPTAAPASVTPATDTAPAAALDIREAITIGGRAGAAAARNAATNSEALTTPADIELRKAPTESVFLGQYGIPIPSAGQKRAASVVTSSPPPPASSSSSSPVTAAISTPVTTPTIATPPVTPSVANTATVNKTENTGAPVATKAPKAIEPPVTSKSSRKPSAPPRLAATPPRTELPADSTSEPPPAVNLPRAEALPAPLLTTAGQPPVFAPVAAAQLTLTIPPVTHSEPNATETIPAAKSEASATVARETAPVAPTARPAAEKAETMTTAAPPVAPSLPANISSVPAAPSVRLEPLAPANRPEGKLDGKPESQSEITVRLEDLPADAAPVKATTNAGTTAENSSPAAPVVPVPTALPASATADQPLPAPALKPSTALPVKADDPRKNTGKAAPKPVSGDIPAGASGHAPPVATRPRRVGNGTTTNNPPGENRQEPDAASSGRKRRTTSTP